MATKRHTEPAGKPAEQPPAQAPAKEPDTAVHQLQSFLNGLSGEQRRELLLAGYSMPMVIGDSDALIWGYRCAKCNGVALEFVGEKFQDLQGRIYDHPPKSARFFDLPWIQRHLDQERVNRHYPICQHCCQSVDHLNGRLLGKRIIRLAEWGKSRDEAYRRAIAERDELERRARETPEVNNPTLIDEPQMTWVDPEQREKLSELSDRFGLGPKAFPRT